MKLSHPPESTGLVEPFAMALKRAVAYIGQAFQPVGIIVSGSIIRGMPDPTSDLDFVVLHSAAWRQRVQRRFNGVPAEIFINSPQRLARTFSEEVASARPVMLHMVSTGQIVFDPNGAISELQQTAGQVLARGPRQSAESLTLARYGIVTALEDAEDIRNRDPDRAMAMLATTMLDTTQLRFRLDNTWLPRTKELFQALDEIDPDLARLIRQVLSGTNQDGRVTAARQAVQMVVGTTGFFSWSSAPQPD